MTKVQFGQEKEDFLAFVIRETYTCAKKLRFFNYGKHIILTRL